jgi:hypothetical protein
MEAFQAEALFYIVFMRIALVNSAQTEELCKFLEQHQ